MWTTLCGQTGRRPPPCGKRRDASTSVSYTHLDVYKRQEPTRLSYQEKMEVVRSLDEKGIFLVKGAITELAAALKTTEVTIYRYINKLQQ